MVINVCITLKTIKYSLPPILSYFVSYICVCTIRIYAYIIVYNIGPYDRFFACMICFHTYDSNIF